MTLPGAERYFDNAATTPLDPRVLAEMMPFLGEAFGNANSLHGFGRRAADAVDLARERVVTLLGAEDPSQIVFTSGATESNNWVLRTYPDGWISPYEHASVWEPAKRLGMRVLPNAELNLDAPPERASLVSVMEVNNEIGTVWHARDYGQNADRVHSDVTQALGKIPIDLEGLDYASFSAHKLYGPKGVGGLYAADGPPRALIVGGEQEDGARAGTLNVPGVVGFGAAAAIAVDEGDEDREAARTLREIVLDELRPLSDWRVNGGGRVSPFILSLSFLGVEGETLVIEADGAGYAVSAGSACSSRSADPSHVLTALGLDESWLRGTVRVSFGRFNSAEAAKGLAQTLLRSVQKLRTMT